MVRPVSHEGRVGLGFLIAVLVVAFFAIWSVIGDPAADADDQWLGHWRSGSGVVLNIERGQGEYIIHYSYKGRSGEVDTIAYGNNLVVQDGLDETAILTRDGSGLRWVGEKPFWKADQFHREAP
jgi:hypothetical protein